jgi:tetratricopeptide (TPR) repeat protein
MSTGSPAANGPAPSPVGIEGRTLTFNGVSYIALARSRQLNDADAYPLRHQQSELVVFEVKVFRCEPGTATYDEVKARPPRSFRTKAEMSTLENSGAHLVVEEIYEQDGHLLGFQRAYREHPGPAYHAEKMAEAQALFQKRQFAEAVTVYDAILALNPYHAVALGNKGLALMNSGDVAGSLTCFERCVGIDVNMAEPQMNMAACLAVTGQAERATLTLARLLKRYPWSFECWMPLVHMATTEDTLDLAQRFIDPGLSALTGVPVGDRVRAAMEESRTRWQAYLSTLERARSQQIAQRWGEAIEPLASCSGISPRHAVASLNLAICQYHVSDMTACRNTLMANHHRLFDQSHRLTSLLLWLLSAVPLGDWQGAMAVVSGFHEHLAAGTAIVEMPRVPVAVMPHASRGHGASLAAASSLETLDVAPILAALTALAGRPECQRNVGTIEAVVAAYKQLASL